MDRLRGLIARLACLVVLLVPLKAPAEALFGLIGEPGVNVQGFGWFADLYLERSLEILRPDSEEQRNFDSVYIEDATWILAGEIRQKGYLEPQIKVTAYEGDEVIFEALWDDGDLDPNAPQDLLADELNFEIIAGLLYYFDTIEVEGIPAEITRQPASFFYATNQLIVSRGDRFFTEGRMNSGLNRLISALKDAGHREAKILSRDFELNHETGAVAVYAEVDPGPVFYADALVTRIYKPEAEDGQKERPKLQTDLMTKRDENEEETALESESSESFEERRVAPQWVGEATRRLRGEYFAKGYPEVFIEADYEVHEESGERVSGPLILNVYPGERAVLNEVRYEGGEDVAPWLLKQQTSLKTGEPLNRTDVEEGRDRLGRLGVFRRIRIGYEEVEPGEWDVIYQLDPKGTTEIDLIFGVGSFDIVRGGFQIERNNLWGIAHKADFRAVQSFKATYVDMDYNIPQIGGANVDLFSKLGFLRRQELTFLREEWGIQSGLQHYIEAIDVNAAATFTLDNVRAANRNFFLPPGPLEARIGSLGFRFSQSNLDSPVFPTDGYHWYAVGEFARPFFGGNVDFDLFEVGGAYHHPLGGGGLILHLGFKHGVIITDGEALVEIPVNRRFFLGGENTVRGYKRDEASPVDIYGQQIGAVSYMLWQGELEQRINDTFSLVVFVDAVGNAAYIANYPFNEVLISVGGGVSIRTIIGPLRLEYGYNVKRRSFDPEGRFQVGLGFPF
ncbi:MAG: BamA/OMP85 family outer membrane protein [Puniceicoccales bacterium]